MQNVNLERVSGVAAILTGISALVAFGLYLSSDLVDADTAAEILTAVDADQELAGAAVWLLTLAPILYLGALLGIYQGLRGAGGLVKVALAAGVFDVVFIVVSNLIGFGIIYEIAPAYVETGSAEILVVGDALLTTAEISQIVGDAIGLGVGVLLFSVAILNTGYAPKWIGWLGILSAIGGWITLAGPASEVLELIAFIGAIAFFIWVIALGIVMVRKEAE